MAIIGSDEGPVLRGLLKKNDFYEFNGIILTFFDSYSSYNFNNDPIQRLSILCCDLKAAIEK